MVTMSLFRSTTQKKKTPADREDLRGFIAAKFDGLAAALHAMGGVFHDIERENDAARAKLLLNNNNNNSSNNNNIISAESLSSLPFPKTGAAVGGGGSRLAAEDYDFRKCLMALALAPDKFATMLGDDTQQQQQPSPAGNQSAATLAAAGGGVDGRGGHGGAVAMSPTAEPPPRGKPSFASALVEEDSLNGDGGGGGDDDDGCLLYRDVPAVCVFSARCAMAAAALSFCAFARCAG